MVCNSIFSGDDLDQSGNNQAAFDCLRAFNFAITLFLIGFDVGCEIASGVHADTRHDHVADVLTE